MDYIIDVPDTVYPVVSEQERERKTVRAILVNEKNEVYLIHAVGEDEFGPREHYETPGGGVEENESNIDALRREVMEETGYTIKDISYIGNARIEYHLLSRHDDGAFFVCHTDKKFEQHLLDYEKALFQNNVWIPVKDVVEFYRNHKTFTVGEMVEKRDLAVFEYAIEKGFLEV